MASWFSGPAALGLGEKLSGLKDKVQSQVNNIDPDLIKKLTLQSDELVSERQQIDEEERRKEAVRDSLAEILPWETRDAEMEILVDECKEVILGLSNNDGTFTGPFILAGGLSTAGEKDGDEVGEDHDRKAAKDLEAAELSAEKLSKLQPLPKLLGEFDLDTHVGLIQRLLQVDPNLVEMQSRLSSGGQRELVFWKNYFFHCAYARYEAGLSIDEIWSSELRASPPVTPAAEDFDAVDNEPDEEVIFDSASSAASGDSGSNKRAGSVPEKDMAENDTKPPITTSALTSAPAEGEPSPPASPTKDTGVTLTSEAATPSDSLTDSGGGTDYEFVASAAGVDGDDGSLDELEAEIAAALDE
ncbi:hypothetical protein ACHAWF_000856 [Thalassiosira exigua]